MEDMPQKRRQEDGLKQGPGGDIRLGDPEGLGRAVRPRPCRAVTHLGLLITSPPSYFRKQTHPDHVTNLRQSTNPVRQAVCGPAPKREPGSRSVTAIFYNCPMGAASVARGRSDFRLEPILRGWWRPCVRRAEGRADILVKGKRLSLDRLDDQNPRVAPTQNFLFLSVHEDNKVHKATEHNREEPALILQGSPKRDYK